MRNPTRASRVSSVWATAVAGIAMLLQVHGGLAFASDSLEWLEQPRSERALAWARQATEDTRRELGSLPSRKTVEGELEAVISQSPAEPDIFFVGSRAVRLLRDAKNPYGILQVAARLEDGGPGAWRGILDVAELRRSEGVPFELQVNNFAKSCAAPLYVRCLLRLSPGGGGEVEIREFDLDSGAFAVDGFRVEKSRSFVEWLDPDRILVGHTLERASTSAAGWPLTYRIWTRGQSLANARQVFSGESTDTMVSVASMGSGANPGALIVRAVDFSTLELWFLDADGDVRKLPLPRALNVIALTAQHAVVQLTKDAVIQGRTYRADTVLAYDGNRSTPEDQRLSVVHIPAEGEFVDGGATASASMVYLIVNRKLQQRVIGFRLESPQRWVPAEVMSAEVGDTLTVRNDTRHRDELIVSVSGFVNPRSQYLVGPEGDKRLLARDPELIDGRSFVTEVRSATSKDGTSVDYFLLKPRSPASVPGPALMTGYGAFGFSFRPAYFDRWVGGPSLQLWLKRGGMLVVPVIRGGGERGAAWHQAAIREKRQNSYDDFIAVAEHLIDEGVVTKLGIFGLSNGGLLTAVVGTQRPDLFGAVVSDVPLTDLIRMRHMGTGAAWLDEYGDPDVATQASAILAYSPYQNIRPGLRYPPFLVTVSTEDNVVGPGHARKFAHRLMEVGAKAYFFEEEEGGHDVSDALRNRELMTLRMAFLIDHLMEAD